MPTICLTLLLTLQLINLSAAEARKALSAEERTALLELMNPGPEHEQLKKFSGKWNVELTMGSPGRAAPLKGTANAYMTLEDRFLWIGYQAKGKARAFKGSFTLGFDRRHQHYVLIGMDTSGTYFVTSKGKADPESGLIKLYGKDDDPYMKSMGYEKEFAHALDLSNTDQFSIRVLYVDTRTPERRESTGMLFRFTSKSSSPKN